MLSRIKKLLEIDSKRSNLLVYAINQENKKDVLKKLENVLKDKLRELEDSTQEQFRINRKELYSRLTIEEIAVLEGYMI